MKSIETRYAGYRFRSRTEARWAVFFDALGVQWLYEHQGYELPDGGAYLPDFYLPQVNLLLDVKPRNAVMNGACKEIKFAKTLKKPNPALGLLLGVPGAPEFFSERDNYEGWILFGDGEDFPYYFCLCPWCGKLGFEFDGRGARVCGWSKHHRTEEEALDTIKHHGHWRADDKCYTFADPRLVAAYNTATGARFEHGEGGRAR